MNILVKKYIRAPKALIEIEKLEISPLEKEKLTEMLGLIYHQKLLNQLLLQLDEESKRLFLERHFNESQEEAVNFLESKIENIENVVEKALEEIEEKLLEDFSNLRNETE